MKFKEFMEEIVKGIQKRVKGDVTVKLVRQYNGIATNGVLVQQNGKDALPVIYLSVYYCEYLAGKDMGKILEDICNTHLMSIPMNSLVTSRLIDFEWAKPHIVLRLINYELNKQLLQEIPHQKYLDLAVVFYCMFCDEKGKEQSSILICNQHLEHWGISTEEVSKLAYENTPKLLLANFLPWHERIYEFCDVNWRDLVPDPENGEVPQMIVLTNSSRLYGASCILYPDILAIFAQRLDCNFIILPCSIHEVILIPVETDKIFDREDFCKGIQEINKLELEEEEILSDHPYFFNRKTAQLTME